MTSFAFILGVVPLLISHGAGAEMRRTLGTAVFSGMLGVTMFGIFLTPVFFTVIDRLRRHARCSTRGWRRSDRLADPGSLRPGVRVDAAPACSATDALVPAKGRAERCRDATAARPRRGHRCDAHRV